MAIRTSSVVKIIDTATPFFRHVAKTLPREFDRALKSTGWWLQQEIKKGIKAGAPGGQPYKPFTDVTTSRVLDSMRGRGKIKSGKRYRAARKFRSDHRPLGRLYPATVYRFYKDSRRVVIGWVSASAQRYGAMQEKGTRYQITPKMRRFYWAAGIPLSKGKTFIDVPARPTIGPEYQENAQKVPGYIEDKILGYIQKEASK